MAMPPKPTLPPVPAGPKHLDHSRLMESWVDGLHDRVAEIPAEVQDTVDNATSRPFTPRDAWDPEAVYEVNDAVTHDGQTWVAKPGVEVGDEPGVAATWLPLYVAAVDDTKQPRFQIDAVEDFGADPTGSTDTTAALQAASNAADAAGARLYIGPGTYATSGTVQFRCSLAADQATIRYTGSGTAVVVGLNSLGSLTNRRSYWLPRVVKPTQDWDGTSTGVLTVNLNTCEVYVPFVQNFERGLVVYGFGGGNAHNTYHLGALWQNRKNLVLDANEAEHSYTNQNLFMHGRLQQTLSGGATNDDPDANQILLGQTPGARPNNNLFLNTSVEGNNAAFYRLDVAGRYNKFVNCRWENFGGPSRVRWRADARYNQIEHGYGADQLDETFESGSAGNEVRDRLGAFIAASNTSGFSVPASTFATVEGWTNDSRRAPYVSGNHSWTPRQGRWRITAQVTFSANATGQRRVGIYAGGTQLAVGDTVPASGAVTAVQVTVNHRFTGTQALTVRAWQTSGGPLTLTSGAGFSWVYAEWVGP